MTNITKIKFLICATFIFCSWGARAQTYCSVTTAKAYSLNMPGITNVTLNNIGNPINRTSSSLECGVVNCNSYVNITTSSSYLQQSQTYTVSISHSKDAVSFPNARNNIRVYIDYNQNGTLNDAGETAVSLDLQTPGVVSTATFTVPLNATTGPTRMRVTAKMSADAGHTLPTPCDIPADPFGYHGEIEDYTIGILTLNEISESNLSLISANIFPNPFSENASISYILTEKSQVTLEVYNVLGEKVTTFINSEMQSAGYQEYNLDNENNSLKEGIYFVKFIVGNKIGTQKLIKISP